LIFTLLLSAPDFLPGLHEAVAADSIEAAKYLLARGCLLNATDSMQDELGQDAKPSCPSEILNDLRSGTYWNITILSKSS
jgi:hypothetical protein